MAAKYKLIYFAPASEDILKIVDFYAKQAGPVYARKIYSAIKEQLGQLQRFPLMGQLHPDPELAVLGYRKLVLTKTYVAVYRVIDKTVTVYRVVNGKTDYPRLLT